MSEESASRTRGNGEAPAAEAPGATQETAQSAGPGGPQGGQGGATATEPEEPQGGREKAPVEEAAASTAEPEPQGPSAEELARKLEAAEKKAEEHRDQALRARAEVENLHKRSTREIENAHKYALERFVGELLPVRDSLELGLSAARDHEVDIAKVREGMELTVKMFKSVMDKFGIEEVAPARGDPFDPQYQEAMSTQDVEDVESGHVVMVVQRGYLLNGRLVRPAMVIVAQ
ncbi:MAG: nucleotide exchange factor GrpE [Gammaproteobacteria bacterium]|nr:nucleotide exchange factor GrpE [Gammaproteobacteria bacterium]NIR82836.1 nucleotide exchange factor GrpE [Gammaproteobacteria bacterium]NIR89945.1 nucleotide exchange factor GrpE [Gammaproteobacteria bacterium]NIU03994.1 nucleotide exchange factor GrpE [Gammaproteobacteria bacterium]NIV51314.1 nucleotide exchange factor GrpE [Gammaproteobacteria bacterium]